MASDRSAVEAFARSVARANLDSDILHWLAEMADIPRSFLDSYLAHPSQMPRDVASCMARDLMEMYDQPADGDELPPGLRPACLAFLEASANDASARRFAGEVRRGFATGAEAGATDCHPLDLTPGERETLVTDIARTWNVRYVRGLAVALRARAEAERCSRADAKRRAVQAGLVQVLARQCEPYQPRTDSRQAPIIPARDLTQEQLREWVSREAKAAATCYVLEQPYPRETDSWRDVLTTSEITPSMDGPVLLDGTADDQLNDPEWAEDWMPDEEAQSRARAQLDRLFSDLTPTEKVVVDCMHHLIAERGRATEEDVARALGMEPGAVRAHFHRIRKKHRPAA